LPYFCNTQVLYALRDIHVKFDALWDREAQFGGDTHFAVFRGTRSRIEVRQLQRETFLPELFVIPNRAADRTGVPAALRAKVAALQSRYPGIAVEERGDEFRVMIPDVYRVGHEAHFGEVTRQFLAYLRNRSDLPAWEKPNMLAKYLVTTEGVKLARASG
jgi:hypothetical protein